MQTSKQTIIQDTDSPIRSPSHPGRTPHLSFVFVIFLFFFFSAGLGLGKGTHSRGLQFRRVTKSGNSVPLPPLVTFLVTNLTPSGNSSLNVAWGVPWGNRYGEHMAIFLERASRSSNAFGRDTDIEKWRICIVRTENLPKLLPRYSLYSFSHVFQIHSPKFILSPSSACRTPYCTQRLEIRWMSCDRGEPIVTITDSSAMFISIGMDRESTLYSL